MSPALGLSLTVVFLLVNAYFVAAEFAVTSSRRSQLEPLANDGVRGAKQAMYALEHVSLMLAISQLGITVMSTSLGAIAEPAIAHLIYRPLSAFGLGMDVAHGIAFVVALLIVLFLHVVFGEMVPKNLSIAKSTVTLLALAPSLVAIGRVLRPVVVLMDNTANWFIRHFGFEPRSEIAATFTVEEVANIVEVSREEGKLSDELGLLAGTLEFAETTVDALMIPLDKLATIELPASPDSVESMVAKTGFSRFPVTEGDGGDQEIVGYVHLKDVLYAQTPEERSEPLPPWRVRSLEYIPSNLGAEDALRQMQATSSHVVGIVNEAGGDLVGALFMEDLWEELVGQVRDSLQRGPRL